MESVDSSGTASRSNDSIKKGALCHETLVNLQDNKRVNMRYVHGKHAVMRNLTYLAFGPRTSEYERKITSQ